jgi:hypothetical protein
VSPPIHFEFDSAMQATVPYDSGLETAFTVVHSGIFGFGDFLILRFEDGVQLRMLYMQRSHDRSAAVAGPLLLSLTSRVYIYIYIYIYMCIYVYIYV